MIKEDLAKINNKIILRLFDKMPDLGGVVNDYINILEKSYKLNKNEILQDRKNNLEYELLNHPFVAKEINTIKNFLIQRSKYLDTFGIVLRVDNGTLDILAYTRNEKNLTINGTINTWDPEYIFTKSTELKIFLNNMLVTLLLDTPLYNGVFTNKILFNERTIIPSLKRFIDTKVDPKTNKLSYILPVDYINQANIRLFPRYNNHSFFKYIKNYFNYKHKLTLDDSIYNVSEIFKKIKTQDLIELNSILTKLNIKNKRLLQIPENNIGYILTYFYLSGLYRTYNLSFGKSAVDDFVSNLLYVQEKYAKLSI